MEGPFRFFNLARELRNKIYGELTCDLLSKWQRHPYVELRHYASSNLRLMSKQFKGEYENEVLLCAELVFHTGSQPITSPMRLSNGRLLGSALGGDGVSSKIRKVNWHNGARYGERRDKESVLRNLPQDAQRIERLFPSLATLHLVLMVDADVWRYALKSNTAGLDDVFATDLLSGKDVEVRVTLLIHALLFSMNPRLVRDALLVQMMELSGENYIFYRATRSSGPNAWNGLELATHAAGTYDYDAVKYEAEDQGQNGTRPRRH
ncbi:hypothetical protein LTR36_003985 [Oleoguttula mirabilis]|uniref:Uncharacterized protein n=1 Tax=Oleoguttula mirabilis TaxID=1507867 RepID=A0AAV9JHL9_9PEZI|nr:hypothetical protein LTR36_003985 [Oleoguttula mirabilis]